MGNLLDGELRIRVGHSGHDYLSARFEVARPVERFRRRSIAADVKVEIEFGLRLDRLGGLVRGAQPKTTSSLALAQSGRR